MYVYTHAFKVNFTRGYYFIMAEFTKRVIGYFDGKTFKKLKTLKRITRAESDSSLLRNLVDSAYEEQQATFKSKRAVSGATKNRKRSSYSSETTA